MAIVQTGLRTMLELRDAASGKLRKFGTTLRGATGESQRLKRSARETSTALRSMGNSATMAGTGGAGRAGGIAGLASGFRTLMPYLKMYLGVQGIRMVYRFGKSVVRAGMEQEDAVQGMRGALMALGEDVDSGLARAMEFASALQQVSRFGDETTLTLMATGRMMGLTADETEKVITMSADLAAGTGKSLKQVFTGVARAWQGDYEVLQRWLPGLKKLDLATLKNMKVLTERDRIERDHIILMKIRAALEEEIARFQGQAAMQAKTMAGRITQVEMAYGDLKDQMAKVVLESKGVLSFLRESTKLMEQAQKVKWGPIGWLDQIATGWGRILEKRRIKKFGMTSEELKEDQPALWHGLGMLGIRETMLEGIWPKKSKRMKPGISRAPQAEAPGPIRFSTRTRAYWPGEGEELDAYMMQQERNKPIEKVPAGKRQPVDIRVDMTLKDERNVEEIKQAVADEVGRKLEEADRRRAVQMNPLMGAGVAAGR